jgi:hypothetical protein
VETDAGGDEAVGLVPPSEFSPRPTPGRNPCPSARLGNKLRHGKQITPK